MRIASRTFLLLTPALVALLPYAASAQNVLQKTTGLFNLVVGIMLSVALLLYGGAFVLWVARLHSWPTYRTTATRIMEWSVVILFVLIVLLYISQFFRDHPYAASYLIALIVIYIVIRIILAVAKGGEEKKEGSH